MCSVNRRLAVSRLPHAYSCVRYSQHARFPPPKIFTNALLQPHDITALIRDTEAHERALFSVPPPPPAPKAQDPSSSSNRRNTIFNPNGGGGASISGGGANAPVFTQLAFTYPPPVYGMPVEDMGSGLRPYVPPANPKRQEACTLTAPNSGASASGTLPRNGASQ